jgi:Protein of unknown function (DUF4232)
MAYLSTTARRVTTVIAAASIAGLIVTTTAFAATSSSATRASGTARTSAAAIPSCTSADLGAWVAVDQGNGAAGSIYLPLQFTNLTKHACSMYGFPGVSAIDRHGHQLGSPAGWDRVTAPRTVVLAPGATAHTILRWSDAEVTTAPGCDPVFTASELRIYPPGQYRATHAFFSLEVCSHAGPVYMDVGPILPGVGTING